MNELIEELRWRGLIEQHTDESVLADALNSGPITFYCGFDPTAPSLHHGHLVQLILMRHLQNAGHHPIALVGGATGLIGDPRDVGERSMNDAAVVEGWAARLRAQIEGLLDFEDEKNPARMVNNLDWTGPISAIGLLRDLGKHFRMGTMLSKDVVSRRLNSEEGLSYTEFSYQILQANDFLELFRRFGCTLQTGGNDQWGNLIGGVDLIRKVEGQAVNVMTTPVITKADGTKFGKTAGGAIWLDPEMMSPYDFYQFWLQTSDEDVVRMLKVFTFLSPGQIEDLAVAVAEEPHARRAQRVLAEEVTRFVHGPDELERVLLATEALWGRGELRDVEAATLLAAVQDLPQTDITTGKTSVVDALVGSGLESGRQAALRTVRGNGLSVNNVKVTDPDYVFSEKDLLPGDLVLLRKGRKTLAAGRAV